MGLHDQTVFENYKKMNDKHQSFVKVSGKVSDTRRAQSLASNFFTGLKYLVKKVCVFNQVYYYNWKMTMKIKQHSIHSHKVLGEVWM